MTSIYKMEGGDHESRQGPTGQDHAATAKDLPGKLPTGSRRQATAAAIAALTSRALRPRSLPKD